jgi:hypothetical protein
MKSVSRVEANLLRVLHCLLGRAPVEQALPVILAAERQPPCLSRDAMTLVQEALAKGCVQWLAQNGGWRRERHLLGDRAVEGRIWDRTPPPKIALSFSRHALTFLLWLTTARPVTGAAAWSAPYEELTSADQLLLFLAHEALRGTEASAGLRSLAPMAKNILCRLAYPQDFLHGPALVAADFLPWTRGGAACILEVMQFPLARHWIALESVKARITDWETMQQLGRAQEQAIEPFLAAMEESGRYDLARFVLEAMAALLQENIGPRFWVGGLRHVGPRMADRTVTYRAALAFVRQMDRLGQWERWARGVGYLDEGYAASQLWKQDWERLHGDMLHARAQALQRQLDPLSSPGGNQS